MVEPIVDFYMLHLATTLVCNGGSDHQSGIVYVSHTSLRTETQEMMNMQ